MSSRLMALVWPASLRIGSGAGPPPFSGRSHTRISPRLLPAARRLGPTKLTAVTQSASQGRVQARVALSKDWAWENETNHRDREAQRMQKERKLTIDN